MARRDTWQMMHDLRWFERRWIDPPDEDSRTRRPVAGSDADLGDTIVSWNSTDNSETQRQAQRAAAEALFAPEVA